MPVLHSELYKKSNVYSGTINNYCTRPEAAEALCKTIIDDKLQEIVEGASFKGGVLDYGEIKVTAGKIVISCEKDSELIESIICKCQGEPYWYPKKFIAQDIAACLIEGNPKEYGYLKEIVKNYLEQAINN